MGLVSARLSAPRAGPSAPPPPPSRVRSRRLALGSLALGALGARPGAASARRLDHSNFHIDNEFYSEGAHRFVAEDALSVTDAGCANLPAREQVKCMKRARMRFIKDNARDGAAFLGGGAVRRGLGR